MVLPVTEQGPQTELLPVEATYTDPDRILLFLASAGMFGIQTQPYPEKISSVESLNNKALFSRLKFEEKIALNALRLFTTGELRASIEACRHHGWDHIHSVMENLENSLFQSPSFFADSEKVKGFQEMVGALALAERFHDLVEQNLISQNFADSKQFHDKLGALYLLLVVPELSKQFGYSQKEIYYAAYMSYFHSDPELISANQPLPPVEKMIADLSRVIEENNQRDDKKRKHIPTTLLDFFPVSGGDNPLITRELLEARLKGGFSQTVLSVEESNTLEYWARRFALADKIESLYPPKDANYRTLASKPNRAFFISLNQEKSLEQLQTSLDKTRQNIVQTGSNELKIYEQKILLLMNRVNQEEFTSQLELEVRCILGEGPSATDDFSRFMFECLRDYLSLDLTSVELETVGVSLELRLRHLKKIARNLCKIETNSSIRAELERRNIHKSLDRRDLSRVVELINLTIAQIEDRYRIEQSTVVTTRPRRQVLPLEQAYQTINEILENLLPRQTIQ